MTHIKFLICLLQRKGLPRHLSSEHIISFLTLTEKRNFPVTFEKYLFRQLAYCRDKATLLAKRPLSYYNRIGKTTTPYELKSNHYLCRIQIHRWNYLHHSSFYGECCMNFSMKRSLGLPAKIHIVFSNRDRLVLGSDSIHCPIGYVDTIYASSMFGPKQLIIVFQDLFYEITKTNKCI